MNSKEGALIRFNGLILTIQEKAKPDKKSGTENQRVRMRTAGCFAKHEGGLG